MKKLVLLALLFSGVAEANLPDFTQVLFSRFQPRTCGQNAPEIPVQFVPPAPGYDTAVMNWTMATQIDLDVTSLSPFSDNTVTATTTNFTMQARFPLVGMGNWFSRGWNNTPLVLAVTVPALGHASDSQLFTYYQQDQAGGIDQMIFNGNTVYFKCLSGLNSLQMTGSNQVVMGINGKAVRLEIIWKDLF